MAQRSFCCCCTNRQGTKAFAIVHFVFGALFAFEALNLLIQGQGFFEERHVFSESPAGELVNALAFSALGLLLWYGEKKGKSAPLLIWQVLVAIFIVLFTIGAVVLTYGALTTSSSELERLVVGNESIKGLASVIVVAFLIFAVGMWGVMIWLWLVVHATRREFEETPTTVLIAMESAQSGYAPVETRFEHADLPPAYSSADETPVYSSVNEKR